MSKSIMYTLKTALVLACVLPFAATAQETEPQAPAAKADEFYLRPSYWKPNDQRGLTVFETTKQPDSIPFQGTRIRFGAGFTQTFQGLEHENAFETGPNKLYKLTPGFNTASANLNIDVQLADGIRLALETYLSSRHHNETWVKGGYIQFDKLPFKGQIWEKLMDVATIKIGHFGINYGDAQFRRSDGGNTIFNPFVENNIVDAFATEIGGEVYLKKNGLIGMVGVTNGMIKGNIDDVGYSKKPSVYAKGGFDKNLTEKLRVRGTASYYHNGQSGRNTLYSGDRTGSNYFYAMDRDSVMSAGKMTKNTSAFASGRLDPGFSRKVDAVMLNGFVKAGGLELFGTYEIAKGRNGNETADRKFNQLSGDVIYRLGKNENLYVGARYNVVNAELQGFADEVTVDRLALAAGWFLTKNILLKGEIVNQNYKDFPKADYRYEGNFKGYVVQAVIGF